MPRPILYPRGFVLANGPFDESLLPAHFRTLEINGGRRFVHDPLRTPCIAYDQGTGRFVLVHGMCFPVGTEAVDNVAEWLLDKHVRDREDFLDALDVLAGRHVIIAGDPRSATVYQDAVGARSVYYSPRSQLVASHAHLIHDLAPHPPTDPQLIPTKVTATWDLTPWEGIHALMPNHSLEIGTWRLERFYPRQPNPYTDWSVEQRLSAVEDMWQRQLDALTGCFEDIVVSVTGGTDSRVVLAMARQHLSSLKGFTYTVKGKGNNNPWRRSLSQDRRLVVQLREFLPMEHQFFSFGDRSAPVTPDLATLLDRNALEQHGRWLIPHFNRFLPDNDDVVHLRGNAFEIGRAYWEPRPDNDTVADVCAQYAKKAVAPPPGGTPPMLNEQQQRYFDRMTDVLGYHGPLWGYHRLDLLYWEQRCGRWLSEILNETDVSFETLMPVNIRAVLDILLSFDIEDRRSGYPLAELVNRNYPVLNFVGKNEDRNLYEQVRDAERAEHGSDVGRTRAWLEPGVVIIDADGTVLETMVRPDGCHLQMPLRHFVGGRCAVRKLRRIPEPGSIAFTFQSPYAAQQSLGRFKYQVVVSGTVMAEVDGADWGEESRITVHNLSEQDTVEIRVVALAEMTRPSWSSATKAHLTQFTLIPRRPDGPVRVASSDPYTRYPTN